MPAPAGRCPRSRPTACATGDIWCGSGTRPATPRAACGCCRDPDEDRWGTPCLRPAAGRRRRARLPGWSRTSSGPWPASRRRTPWSRPRTAGCSARSPAGSTCRCCGSPTWATATLPEARGRGVASTALRLLADWLLDPGPGRPAAGPAGPRGRATSRPAGSRSDAGFDREGVRRAYLPLCDPRRRRPAGPGTTSACTGGWPAERRALSRAQAPVRSAYSGCRRM